MKVPKSIVKRMGGKEKLLKKFGVDKDLNNLNKDILKVLHDMDTVDKDIVATVFFDLDYDLLNPKQKLFIKFMVPKIIKIKKDGKRNIKEKQRENI